MGAPDILGHLAAVGVRLTRRGDNLIAAPTEAVTPSVIDLIRTHKSELLAALGRDPDPAVAARRQRAELLRLIDRLAEETGYFTEADKLEALEVALRDPGAWLGYLPLLLERCAAGVH